MEKSMENQKLSKNMVEAKRLIFEYEKHDKEGQVTGSTRAIDEIDIDVAPGSFVAILGSNGSGKSTLAKHINALLLPTGGTVWVNGIDTKIPKETLNIRQLAGMVFQNPDNQIIGTVVEEDVGFGPENLGIPTDDIWKRVEDSLKAVNMLEYRHRSPNRLSGGQKQRVAIAGVIAMEPSCIVLDEATAMLDPIGRREVISSVLELKKKKNVTVIWITHYMEEVINADKIFVMDKGKIAMEGTPREVFSQVDGLKRCQLDVPQVTMVAEQLRSRGLDIPKGIIRINELVEVVASYVNQPKANGEDEQRALEVGDIQGEITNVNNECNVDNKFNIDNEYSVDTECNIAREKECQEITNTDNPQEALCLENIGYTYSAGTPFEKQALKDINLRIPHGQMVGIIGQTGSGKSTLIQHMNGLLKANSGTLYYNGENIYEKKYDLKNLRTQVGMVFQYPEHQLFDVDILSDVSFGPKNQGLSEEEANKRATKALKLVGFPKESYLRSPFELSGGQKRRGAIAGVLAMEPKVLVLDEPTAGLDPKGRDDILGQISKLHKETGITVILVSHSMEDIAKYVDRIIVLHKGMIVHDNEPAKVFSEFKYLEKIGLAAPQVTYLMNDLKQKGIPVNTDITTAPEAADEIVRCIDD